MQRLVFLILIFISFITNGLSQQAPLCGTDKYLRELRDKYPELADKEAQSEQLLYNRAIEGMNNQKSASVVLNVPVVVHLVHQNGPENLSDSLVTAAIDELNLRFQNAGPYYDSTGTDVQIQFCLATVDPLGNPATGITRTFSICSYLGQSPGATETIMKNLIRWEPYLYMNVWVINSLPPGSNVAGYATGPSWAGTSYDGIVILYNYMNNSHVLTHEAGHYLGLHHTWMNGCTNFNCLLDGDKVCDTPPDNSSNFTCPDNSCNTELYDSTGLSPFITDVYDLPNYMDYTFCPLSFSNGQSVRMNDALMTLRSQLLQSNGCGQNPGGAIPVASFSSATGCPDITFTNTSLNGVGASWDFNADGQIDAAGNSVTYNFPVTGYYDITMYSFGYGGVDSITQNVFVPVRPYQNYPLQSSSGIGLSVIEQDWAVCGGDTVILYGEPGMVSYNWSTGETTQNISFVPTAPFTINLTCVDSAGITWNTCTPAHAVPVSATIPPILSLLTNDTTFCTDDYGDTVTLFADFSPLMLFNIWFGPQATIPNFSDSVLNYTISTLYSTFFVNQIDSNGCHSQSNVININLGFSVPSFPIMQNGDTLSYNPNIYSTQWYFNGVPIPGATGHSIIMDSIGCYKVFGWILNPGCGTFSSDSICNVASGLSNAANSNEIKIFPNPASDLINIVGADLNQKEYSIFDSLGKEIIRNQLDHTSIIPIRELNNGVYFLRLRDSYFRIVKL